MDLSGLKWPLIIGVVVLIGWLMSSPGVNYMYNSFTAAEVGADPDRDQIDEAGLSRVGGYMLFLWRYRRAADFFEAAIDRYGSNGANYYYNYYRLATCRERTGQYAAAIQIYDDLYAVDANSFDDRVPINDNLLLRANKLRETHELGETRAG